MAHLRDKAAILIHCCLLFALATQQAQLEKQPGQQQLDSATCQLMCVSCQKSRLVYAQYCAKNSTTNSSSTDTSLNSDCPCLQTHPNGDTNATTITGNLKPAEKCLEDLANRLQGECPEPQPPPPPPGCPPGGSVRCDLVGPGGRCYGNCVCLSLTTPPPRPAVTEPCPSEPCPPSNCSCTDTAAGPGTTPAPPAKQPPPPSSSASCWIPTLLIYGCRRFCRFRYGGNGQLQVDKHGCEQCSCCRPCDDGSSDGRSVSCNYNRNSATVDTNGCPKCQC